MFCERHERKRENIAENENIENVYARISQLNRNLQSRRTLVESVLNGLVPYNTKNPKVSPKPLLDQSKRVVDNA